MNPLKRALLVVAFLAALCFVLLFLLLREFEELETPEPPPPSDAAWRVEFDDGTPAAGARVYPGAVAGGPGVRLADGTLRSDHLEQLGNAEVVAALGPLVSPAVELSSGATLRLPPTFDLAGRVQRRSDRAGVWGARVVCAGAETISDADGAFRLRGVPAGALREPDVVVVVTAEGYGTLRWPLPRDELPPYYGDLTLLLRP